MADFTMEEHLKLLLQNTTAQRYKTIHENVQLALDTLETQKLSYAFKAWQIREKCVSVLKAAVESNNPSLITIGLQAIEHAVFHPDLDGITGEDDWDAMDARIFVLQVLDALSCMPHLDAEHQVQGLKILLTLCCDFVPSFDGELIIKIVQFCAASCAKENVSSDVHGAAESLSSQVVEKLAKADIGRDNGNYSEKLADVIGLAKFFVQQTNRAESDSQRGLFLECLLSVLKTLKSKFVRQNEMFCNLIRQDLCPCLATVICMTEVRAKTRPLKFRKYKKKKASTQKNSMVTKSVMLHWKVAMLSVELVRLVGCVASLRPHIAVIFTHMLSDVALMKHGIPFFILKQLWSSPEMLFDLAGPFLIEDLKEKQNVAGILQMIIHAMATSCGEKSDSSSQIDNIQSSVLAISSLLESLDVARGGEGLRSEQVSRYFQTSFELSDAEEDGDDDDGSSLYEDVALAEESPLEEEEDSGGEEGDAKGQEEKEQTYTYQNYARKSLSDLHRGYLSDEDDIWMSSEDLRPSSPFYLSAEEEPSEFQDKQVEDDRVSTSSTHTASDGGTIENDGIDSDGDIEKYIEDHVLPNSEQADFLLTDGAMDERNRILSRRFMKYITQLLPRLLECSDVATLDQSLQQAASQFCHEIYATWHVKGLSIQADSLYILSYASLLLALHLHLNGYYEGSGVQLPCVKSQWVAFQQTSGVYLSKSWLSETFKQILITDMFRDAGYDATKASDDDDDVILIKTLIDIDGVLQNKHKKISLDPISSPLLQDQALKAGSEFARQLSVSIWNLILDILQFSFGVIQGGGFTNSLFLLFSPTALRTRSSREHDVIMSSLDGLRCAVKLSCSLGTYSYSGSVLAQMVEACIPDGYLQQDSEVKLDQDDLEKMSDLRLHMCHVLCMDAVIDVALQVGCHAPNKWKSLFRLVMYVAYLESKLCFKQNGEPGNLQTAETSIATLVKENSSDIKWSNLSSGGAKLTSLGFLTHERTIKCVKILAAKLDLLFEKASTELNLRNTVNFIWHLGQSSRDQLYNIQTISREKLHKSLGTLLLFRLGDCALKCTRLTNRPLLHIGSVWNMCAPHFAKAAGHPNPVIAEQAVSFVFNAVSIVLTSTYDIDSNHTLALWSEREPVYFHFSEALLQPFERAVQLEACSQAVQDQIASCISKLVKTASNQIASGWRPLFSTLRNINFSKSNTQVSPVVEVLKSFFAASQSSSVFANAAHDCIKCLLKMLTLCEDNRNQNWVVNKGTEKATTDFVSGYLDEIHNILMEMRKNEFQEKFHNSFHIDVTPACSGDGSTWQQLVTPQWLLDNGETVEETMNKIEKLAKDSFATEENETKPTSPAKTKLVNHCLHDNTGLLATWFSLMDGLTSSVLPSSHGMQPVMLDLLCCLLEKTWKNPGPVYCFHILLHSCLPTLILWMPRIISDASDDVIGLWASYKHMFGTIVEYATDVLHRHLLMPFSDKPNSNNKKGSFDVNGEKSLLEQNIQNIWIGCLNLCVHAIKTRKEPLAKLGCSCLRHILTSLNNLLTPTMISDFCRCIRHSFDHCLLTINSLVTMFDEGLQDNIHVEVKESRSNLCDPSCLQRVFQSNNLPSKSLAFEPHPESYVIFSLKQKFFRVSLCEMSCDLSSVHLLMKCIEHMLLGSSRSPWQRQSFLSHHNRQQNNNSEQSSTNLLHSSNNDLTNHETTHHKQPVMLDRLQPSEIHDLCSCVAQCFVVTRNFDQHRFLQRFVQKLAKFYSSANLYQLSSLSFDSLLHIILALCSHFSLPASSSHPHHPRLNSILSVEDIIPNITTKPPYHHLKSADSASRLSWVHSALSKSLVVISNPWGDEEFNSTQTSDQESFYMLQDQSSMEDGVSSEPVFEEENEASEESSENQSISLDMDYMAYVKRSFQNVTAGRTVASKNSSNNSSEKKSTGRRIYSVAGEKTIGKLINAYKKRKQHQGATTIVPSTKQTHRGPRLGENKDEPNHVRSTRSLSESSGGHSVLPLDEREMEREAWCMVVDTTLRLLTSAPDHVLTQLLPIVYYPLTALARQQHSLVLQESHNCDVGDAFHKWLLRVGDLCHFNPTSKEFS